MPDYKIGDNYVSAPNEETAKRIVEVVIANADSKRLIIIDTSDEIIVLKLGNDKPIMLYGHNEKSTRYAGMITISCGDKIIQSAIDSIMSSKKDVYKLAQLSLKKIRTNPKDIEIFESSLTSATRALYDDTMKRIDTVSISNKLDLLSNLGDIRVPTECWLPILAKMRSKLDDEETKPKSEMQYFYALRKYFATLIGGIVTSGIRSSNTMRTAKQDGKPDIDWLKYAKNKNGS